MQIQYLGTGAAEGLPALFCHCENCRRARLLGGHNIRSRSQTLIDDKILIDWPADSFMHMRNCNIDYAHISTLLITHTHGDHFYPADFAMRRPGFAHIDDCKPLDIYGSEDILPDMEKYIVKLPESNPNLIRVHIVAPRITFEADGYRITPLEAVHGTDHPYVYVIEHGQKTLFYAHDTDIFEDAVWNFIKNRGWRFDFVSMDCTEGLKPIEYRGHMNFERNLRFRKTLKERGAADGNTVFCLNHFSHNAEAALYDDMAPIAEKEGFIVAYDGMKYDF
ncbi:MAG TPA: MBL fold metallo-hydrolase [Oscillospiraceae bacterium]|nr:MBL fold metallo-hydrolase [Oscillospiraceae bacterium]HPF55723.1 MBL fold metallo-hydrolase [Clostridiales bacterium]HPK36127.1 MBL fold metallo-hydrolase [Oscillospiraceae bacterium]HPR76479.1 MBL fold metallo-hydrolase [Oscillospiraceae bacterium]